MKNATLKQQDTTMTAIELAEILNREGHTMSTVEICNLLAKNGFKPGGKGKYTLASNNDGEVIYYNPTFNKIVAKEF